MRRLRCALAFALALEAPSPALAETSSDFRIQSDRASLAGVDRANAHALDDQVYSSNYWYFKSLLDDGYPLQSVMLHAVARGMTVSDTAYYLTLAAPDEAEEIWATFTELLPSLPSWVCSSELDMSYYRRSSYETGDLDGAPTIHAVAERYFTNDERLQYRRAQKQQGSDWEEPDWTRGEHHIMADIDELIALAQANTLNGRQGWWYQPAASPAEGTPVLVGLYRRNSEIVVDTPLARLQEMKRAGALRVPVIFVFNTPEYLPIHRLGRDTGEADTAATTGSDGEPTIRDVADAYFGQAFIGARVTPPREWHLRDYHITASIAEIDEFFDVPRVGDLPAGKREDYRAELAEGFGEPVLVTLFGDARKMWLDDPGRVAVAADLGMTEIPLVFLYHDLRRYPCNLPGTCLPAAREAILAASATGPPGEPGGPGTGGPGTPTTPPTLPVIPPPLRPPGIVEPPDGLPPQPTSPE